jgi:hypothetical protein
MTSYQRAQAALARARARTTEPRQTKPTATTSEALEDAGRLAEAALARAVKR